MENSRKTSAQITAKVMRCGKISVLEKANKQNIKTILLWRGKKIRCNEKEVRKGLNDT